MLSYQIFINILKEYFHRPYMLCENFIMDRSTRENYWHVLSFSILNYFEQYFILILVVGFNISVISIQVCHLFSSFWLNNDYSWLAISDWSLRFENVGFGCPSLAREGTSLLAFHCNSSKLIGLRLGQTVWIMMVWSKDKLLRKQLMLYIQLVYYMVVGDIFWRQNAKDVSW